MTLVHTYLYIVALILFVHMCNHSHV